MRRSKWLGFAATAFCALILGAGTSVATQSNNTHRPDDGVSQYGKVDNGTEQHADSSAETPQKNKNTPFSLFAVGTNNGKVDQFNKADTDSSSSNGNKTSQALNQDQHVEDQGHGHGHKREGHKPEHKRNDCDRREKGKRSDDGKRSEEGHGNDGAKQDGTVDNWTEQHANSSAETRQTNVNVPISILSFGSNNGEVDQYNQAGTRSKSENGNETYQQADQRQDVSGKDGRGADGGKRAVQKGSVSNGTDQDATSYAQTKQVNVNAPISVLSFGSNNGDVHQGNNANTDSSSSNWNGTGQSASQSQHT